MKGYDTIVCRSGHSKAEVCVCISLYNYEHYIIEALESVGKQTISILDVVVVDDRSTDRSQDVARLWMIANQNRFNNVNLVTHRINRGLSAARNTAFSIAQTEYIFVLDADNSIYPRCIERSLQAIRTSEAAFAYCSIERYDSETGTPDAAAPLMGVEDWSTDRLSYGNYIDAMALIRKRAWASVGGYRDMKNGWEDYDLWCKFAEKGQIGIHVPEILCRYRVHHASMVNTSTRSNSGKLIEDMLKQHPWLKLG